MKDPDKQTVLQYVRELSEGELIEFFYEATNHLSEEKQFADGFEIEKYCFVRTSYGKINNVEDKTHESEFMAKPKAEFEDLVNANKATEQGKCQRCKASIACVAKEAVCPICGSVVECT